MGTLEKSARQQRLRGNVQKAVLITVGAVGVLSIMLVAPNVFKALKMFGIKPERFNDKVRRATTRLIEKGYLVTEKNDGKTTLHLSEKGERILEEIELKGKTQTQRNKRWDKRWRLVVFDIPEKRRKVRNALRDMIISLGFVKIQNSVWVYPYDCEELVTLLKVDLRLHREVLYAIVEKIENDAWIRKHFHLPVD